VGKTRATGGTSEKGATRERLKGGGAEGKRLEAGQKMKKVEGEGERGGGERSCGRRTLLQESAKLLNGQSGVTNDTAEGKGIDRVMTGNRQDARAV
jgi:hypothetical protein